MSLFDDAMLQEETDPTLLARARAKAMCSRANQALRDLHLIGYSDMLFYPSEGGAAILARSTPERFEELVRRLEDLT